MITGTSVKATILVASLSIMSLTAVPSQAQDPNAVYMAACMAEVEQHYGKMPVLSVVNKRRVIEGTRVKLSARINENKTEFVNCWVPNERAHSGDYSQGASTMATTVTPVRIIQ